MKNIIWLSPSLAAGAVAARLVVFFERRPQMSPRWGVELTAPSRPASEPAPCGSPRRTTRRRWSAGGPSAGQFQEGR